MTETLPRLGAALCLKEMTQLQDWMRAHDRALEIQDFVTYDAITKDRADILAGYAPLLAGYGGDIGIHGPFIGLDIASNDPGVRAVVTERLLQGLEIAEALGGTHMVVHSPFTFWHHLNRQNYTWIVPQMIEDACACLMPVLQRAADIGCTLMLENIDDADPKMRADLVAALDHPNMKLSIDTGHAQLANGQYSAPPVTDFIMAAGEMLGHVHLQDADGYADRHWHPLEGTLPWPAIFNAIKRGGGDPRLIIEVSSRHELLPQTVARLEARGIAC